MTLTLLGGRSDYDIESQIVISANRHSWRVDCLIRGNRVRLKVTDYNGLFLFALTGLTPRDALLDGMARMRVERRLHD